MSPTSTSCLSQLGARFVANITAQADILVKLYTDDGDDRPMLDADRAALRVHLLALLEAQPPYHTISMYLTSEQHALVALAHDKGLCAWGDI
jgi:hypothetical protein